jgi:ribonuclease R
VMEGKFVRKANGKNSVIPDGEENPIFVSERNSMGALNGDRVEFTFLARRKNHIKEAQVNKILERAKDTFVGRLKVDKDLAYLVTPSDVFAHNIIIPRRKVKGGKTDDKAVVRIIEWPDGENKSPIGEVVEMNSILAQYGLPYKYPKNVEDAANKISGEITEQDYKEREDFRKVFTCTIDPKDAKDFDDALSIQRLENGNWQVGVHIADVSHYVTEGSIIDKEAVKRATSVYLVDRTIPMLPERLCNFICSLRPNEEKLAYSVIFELDNNAEVKNYRIVHTVIESDRRYKYEEVQELLEANGVVDGTSEPAPAETKEHPYQGENALQLITLDRLAKKLRAARFKNGAVKFDREELHFDIRQKSQKAIKAEEETSVDASSFSFCTLIISFSFYTLIISGFLST